MQPTCGHSTWVVTFCHVDALTNPKRGQLPVCSSDLRWLIKIQTTGVANVERFLICCCRQVNSFACHNSYIYSSQLLAFPWQCCLGWYSTCIVEQKFTKVCLCQLRCSPRSVGMVCGIFPVQTICKLVAFKLAGMRLMHNRYGEFPLNPAV